MWEKDIFRFGLGKGLVSLLGGVVLPGFLYDGRRFFFLEWKRRAVRPIVLYYLQRKSGRIYCIDRNEERIISKKLRKRVRENERESGLETVYGER